MLQSCFLKWTLWYCPKEDRRSDGWGRTKMVQTLCISLQDIKEITQTSIFNALRNFCRSKEKKLAQYIASILLVGTNSFEDGRRIPDTISARKVGSCNSRADYPRHGLSSVTSLEARHPSPPD